MNRMAIRLLFLAILGLVAPALFADYACEVCEISSEGGTVTASCELPPDNTWGSSNCEVQYRQFYGGVTVWCPPPSGDCYYIEVYPQ